MRSFYYTKNVFIIWSLEQKYYFILCLSIHFPLSKRCPYYQLQPSTVSVRLMAAFEHRTVCISSNRSLRISHWEVWNPFPVTGYGKMAKKREREHASSPSPVGNHCSWHGELQQNHICLSKKDSSVSPKRITVLLWKWTGSRIHPFF